MGTNKKPLREWTLGEIQEACEAASVCRNCQAQEACALAMGDKQPRLWDLNPKPYFTEDETAAIRVIRAAIPWAKYMRRYPSGRLMIQELYGEGPGATGRNLNLPDKLFQALLPGQAMEL